MGRRGSGVAAQSVMILRRFANFKGSADARGLRETEIADLHLAILPE